MEAILALYTQPYDPHRPLICMDEAAKQLLRETHMPFPIQPGHPERFDYEYERAGVANLFISLDPFAGQRYVKVTNRRTFIDWAFFMREVADEHYPDAAKIVVVLDNLNTHTPASFYLAFTPEEARRLTTRFEFHYTPKHGSWLNMAEIELSVLARQCLATRVPDQDTLQVAVSAWQLARNHQCAKVDWRFSTLDARLKLKRLYPNFHP